jgi:hypothetical protein
MALQMQQKAVDFLLHCLEIYGTLYLFYTALWLRTILFFKIKTNNLFIEGLGYIENSN